MVDIQSMITSQTIVTLKKYSDDYISPWKSILDTFLGEVGVKHSSYTVISTLVSSLSICRIFTKNV